MFKDITPLLLDPARFRRAVELMAAPFAPSKVRRVVSIESRGFLLGAPIALLLEAGLVPHREAGEAPPAPGGGEYAPGDGPDALEKHPHALGHGERGVVGGGGLGAGGPG